MTTAWWDNIWLNEGFATWMEQKATNHFYPEWNFETRTGIANSRIMDMDARKTTHPIQQPVKNPTDAISSFDGITYTKGAAFLRMLEAFVGEKPFRDGIRAYIEGHLYSNATTADLSQGDCQLDQLKNEIRVHFLTSLVRERHWPDPKDFC